MKLESIDVERAVRFFLGLPTAGGYFYARHFSQVLAYGFLSAGLGLLLMGLAVMGRKATVKTTTTRVPFDDTSTLAHGF